MENDTSTDLCIVDKYSSLDSFLKCVKDQALSRMRYMSNTQVATFTLAYAIISLIGVVGNGLVIFVVVRRREMRTNRNVFIVNLALCNFVLAVILVPFLWTPTYRIEFSYGSFMCKVVQAFPGANIFCSTLTVSVISIDRYYAVVRTKMGPGKMKVVQATLIAAAIWIVSFLLSILYLLYFDTKDYALPAYYIPHRMITQSISASMHDDLLLFQRCELQPAPCLDMQLMQHHNGSSEACYKFYETAVSAIMAIFIYFVPMPTLVLFNVLLTRFLSKTERQHSQLCRLTTTSSTRTKQSTEMGDSSTALLTNHVTVPLARSISKKPIETNGRRKRSRTTSLLYAMAFSNAVLWLPFTVISLFIQLAPTQLTESFHDELRQLDDAGKLISMLSICVNPFLYGYLNTNFKREFKSIFRWCIPCVDGTHSRSSSSRSGFAMAHAGAPVANEKESFGSICLVAKGRLDEQVTHGRGQGFTRSTHCC